MLYPKSCWKYCATGGAWCWVDPTKTCYNGRDCDINADCVGACSGGVPLDAPVFWVMYILYHCDMSPPEYRHSNSCQHGGCSDIDWHFFKVQKIKIKKTTAWKALMNLEWGLLMISDSRALKRSKTEKKKHWKVPFPCAITVSFFA